jgi:drug/metabolite transporter (DMT)-like permease
VPSNVLAALALTFNAFVWGVSWWPLRQLEHGGLHPLWATAIIFALAVLLIVSVRPAAWTELRTTPGLWWLVVAAGSTNAAFNWAVTIGDVVRVVLLFYLMPLWAVLLARLVLKERLTLAAGLRVLLALAGALTVLWPEQGGWPVPRSLPDALAVLGGVSFALNNVMLRHQARRSQAARALAMFVGGVLVAGGLAAALTAQGSIAPVPPPQAAWLVGVLLLGGVLILSNFALQYGAAQLPANVTAVIMLSEVLFASLSALALGAGAFSPSLAVGGALIVCAAAMAALQPQRHI